MNKILDQNKVLKSYTSRLKLWEKNATVRTAMQRVLTDNTAGKYFYPKSRQPLAIHPKLIFLGESVLSYVLVQSMYKFMNEVAYIETEIVNYSAQNIVNNKLPYLYSEILKQDLMTVIIDEAYHAYVAKDFSQQVTEHTKIVPLNLPATTELAKAIEITKLNLPSYLHNTFALLAVCISENTLTKELVSFAKETDINDTFMVVMTDHLSDEGRHAGIFSDILNITWQAMPEKDKDLVAAVLPEFIINYMKQDIQREFDREILKALHFTHEEANLIINDSYIPSTIEQMKLTNPIIANILSLLKRNHILSHPAIEYHFNESRLLSKNVDDNKNVSHHQNLAKNSLKESSINLKLQEIYTCYGENIALSYHDEIVTYAELDKRCNFICSLMKEHISNDTHQLIGLCLPRGIEGIIAMLAILRSGHAFLPLDPNIPITRLKKILALSGVRIVITNTKIASFISDNVNTLIIENSTHSSEHQYVPVEKIDTLAYVIYTSGSTGEPKGVAISETSVLNLITALQAEFLITPQDNILQFAELTFDVSVAEIFMALMSGSTIIIADENQKQDPKELADLLNSKNITIATLPPAFLALMPHAVFPSLRKLIVTGDVANQQLLEQWQKVTEVINAYGPTEATVWASIAHFKKTNVYNDLGLPLSNMNMYVLNESLEQVKEGEEGELYLSGVGLALSYTNDPIKTAQVFLDNPFSSGNKMYRTGDRVKLTLSGNILFLGRMDRQIKIRGFRVELAEIESTLILMPEITQVAVICKKNIVENEIICFYSTNTNNLTEVKIRLFLLDHLPMYMIPTRFIQKNKLLISRSGKIDYQLLNREFEETSLMLKNNTTSFSTILDCFLHVLQRNDIDENANFFMLGGNSLQAVTLIGLLNQYFNIGLTIKQFAENPTLSYVMQHMEEITNHSSVQISTVEDF